MYSTLFCTVHCNKTVQYKPTKCTFSKFNILNLTLKCAIPVVCIYTNKTVCSQKHNSVCLIGCYILNNKKKIHVSSGSGHHQVFYTRNN